MRGWKRNERTSGGSQRRKGTPESEECECEECECESGCGLGREAGGG